MSTAKIVSIALAVWALMAGLLAAKFWHDASKVNVIPMWEREGVMEPVDPVAGAHHWIVGFLDTITEAGALNKRAALWTAGSVVLSAASALIGALWS